VNSVGSALVAVESRATSDGLLGSTSRLFGHISRPRRFQFLLLLGLTVLGSIAEVVSLGAVVPFIGILTQPERVFASPSMATVVRLLGITSPEQLVLPLTIAFALAAVLAGGLRLLLLFVSTVLANATGADLGTAVYRRTLYQPYTVHVTRSSSEIISGLTQKVTSATAVLISLVMFVTSALLFAAIMLTLFAIDPMVATSAAVIFGAAYGSIAWLTRHRLRRNSQCIAREQTTVIRTLQEGLGAIRDVLLDGTQAVYSDAYGRAVRQLQRATGENSFISLSPRFAMETIGMVLVAALAYSVSQRSGSVGSALPVLAALGLGAQRLLPLLQQLYSHWSVLVGSRAALNDVLDLLEQPLPEHAGKAEPAPLAFKDSIRFENVRFRYEPNSPWVLDGFNLDIPKGARIGVVGTTGSGKSSALDLLMCLLCPTEGRILVDGEPIDPQRQRPWQRSIAHVPQTIFLADATVAENIAFGVPSEHIDFERVREAAAQAQLTDLIEGRPEGLRAVVGERGVRLSGGQRQRIGIARALYKQATVFVFDEATSALDAATETAVMRAIEQLNRELTILIVAHRISTLQHCDTIVQLEHGRVISEGPYEQFADSAHGLPRLVRTQA
jgi:ABC-type multidrug transport system fused ATPase/permease subunit